MSAMPGHAEDGCGHERPALSLVREPEREEGDERPADAPAEQGRTGHPALAAPSGRPEGEDDREQEADDQRGGDQEEEAARRRTPCVRDVHGCLLQWGRLAATGALEDAGRAGCGCSERS